MSPTRDDIRAAILRRRAAFLGSALAAVGCTPSAGDTATTTTAPVVTLTTASGEVPAPEPSATATATASVAAPTERPPYIVPAEAGAEAKKRYERLNEVMQEVHGLLDQVEKDLPSCDVRKGGVCADAFGTIADKLEQIGRTLRFFHVCPGSSEDAKKFAPHHDAHRSFVRQRIAQVTAAVDAAAGKEGADAWAQIKADRAQPQPCLSFACPDW